MTTQSQHPREEAFLERNNVDLIVIKPFVTTFFNVKLQ